MDSNSWRVEHLKEFILDIIERNDIKYEQRFAAQEKAVHSALQSSKEAILKAEASYDKRFEAANEVRAAMIDREKMFMPKSEAELRLKAVEDFLLKVQSQGVGVRSGWSWAVAIVMFAIAVISFLLR